MELIILFFGPLALVLYLAFWRPEAARKQRIKEASTFNPKPVYGVAEFVKRIHLQWAGFFNSGGIEIGFFEELKLFTHSAGHILLVAGARSGKLVTILVRAILTLPRHYSLCLFDTKCEISPICLHYLKSLGRNVYVLNPFRMWPDHLKGLKQATFNPMAKLDPEALSFHSDVNKLVEAVFAEEQVPGD